MSVYAKKKTRNIQASGQAIKYPLWTWHNPYFSIELMECFEQLSTDSLVEQLLTESMPLLQESRKRYQTTDGANKPEGLE